MKAKEEIASETFKGVSTPTHSHKHASLSLSPSLSLRDSLSTAGHRTITFICAYKMSGVICRAIEDLIYALPHLLKGAEGIPAEAARFTTHPVGCGAVHNEDGQHSFHT